MINKTEAQLSSYILQAKKPNYERNDTKDFRIIDTLNLNKYKYIKNWYENYNNRDFKKIFKSKCVWNRN